MRFRAINRFAFAIRKITVFLINKLKIKIMGKLFCFFGFHEWTYFISDQGVKLKACIRVHCHKIKNK